MQSVERRDAPLSIEMTPSNLAVFFEFVVQNVAFRPKTRNKRVHSGSASDAGSAPGECDAASEAEAHDASGEESDTFQPLDEIPDVET